MKFAAFFFGIIAGLPIALVLMKVFRGRFFVITSPYFAGALYGFWTWIALLAALFLDARYDFVGLVGGESGLGLVSLLTSAHTGFITGGLRAAAAWARFLRK